MPVPPVKKAVFLVAGMGTRFLPATKAVPKELLPIIDKPAIQYAVEEAIAAGITELIFVTGHAKRAIEDHFDRNPELERKLATAQKQDLLCAVRNIIPESVSCMYIRQGQPLGTGHALRCALPAIGDNPTALFLPDDVFLGGTGIRPLLDAYNATGKTVIGTVPVHPEETSKYGIINPGHTPGSVRDVIEKPAPGEAPSNEAIIGRYVLSPDIFQDVRDITLSPSGEYLLTDAFEARAKVDRLISTRCSGQRYDCGSKDGYLEAIVDFALAHPCHGEKFRRFLQSRLSDRDF